MKQSEIPRVLQIFQKMNQSSLKVSRKRSEVYCYILQWGHFYATSVYLFGCFVSLCVNNHPNPQLDFYNYRIRCYITFAWPFSWNSNGRNWSFHKCQGSKPLYKDQIEPLGPGIFMFKIIYMNQRHTCRDCELFDFWTRINSVSIFFYIFGCCCFLLFLYKKTSYFLHLVW